MDYNSNCYALPAPVQTFLWKQISPFIRPRLGKLHEASCMELKESCKFFEKVIVQNVLIGLPANLSESIKSVPRWKLIQSSFPYVMHSAASLLHNRNDTSFLSIGAAETKLLYTLHWVVLDSAEECAESDYEKGVYNSSPFYYLFPVAAISLFVYLFAPMCHHLKESDFQNYRLENGLKIWRPLWDYQHPDAACFTAHVKPKPKTLWEKRLKCPVQLVGDFFTCRKGSTENSILGAESPPSQSASVTYSEQMMMMMAGKSDGKPSSDEDPANNWLSSPKDTIFPETIPEESSSTEEEHVVIFRLPSFPETDSIKEAPIYTAETSLFQVAVGQSVSSAKPTLTIEQVTAISGSDTRQLRTRQATHTLGSGTDKEPAGGKTPLQASGGRAAASAASTDMCAATFLDVAVLRCLFVPQWQEEGVYWALQFLYHRLRVISEELPSQQQPRRRSCSLPNPKIEVSVYQSPELKSKEPKDFIEVPDVKDVSYLTESPYFAPKSLHEEGLHHRRASEKVKIRMKMADLKAFVETKLLSKSEKTLEKIGRDEPKPLYEQEYHRSLDTGDEHLSRPSSAFAKLFEIKPFPHGSNLVKGKSMPSLRYIGDVQLDRPKYSRTPHGSQVHAIPNPIITVTEHTPTPSPDYMKRQSSLDVDSLMDAISVPESVSNSRKPSFTRSQTDSNINYPGEEVPEALGSSPYITKDGDIDYHVVLKAVHAAALRDHVCCTLRVCEVILNLVELLMDLGVLKHASREEAAASASAAGSRATLAPGAAQGRARDPTAPSPHGLMMKSVIRVVKHLGCPHGCADGQRGLPVDFLRSQSQNILTKLHRSSSKQFARFMRDTMRRQPVADILDFFHAYVGFCVDPSSLLSPLNQKRSCSKSPDMVTQGGYATNFGAGLGGGSTRGIEGHIVASSFKYLVTRLANSVKELKSQENVAVYCEVRQLMTYVKEAHGGVFRRVALSGLLDSSNRPHRKGDADTQTTRVIRHYHQTDADEQMDMGAGSCYVMDERGSRKLLFKKRSTSSTCPSLLETEGAEEQAKSSQSPLSNFRKKQYMLTPRVSERNLGVGDLLQTSAKTRKQSRFQIGGIMSWFRREHGHAESTDSYEESDSPLEGAIIRQPSLHHMSSKSVHKGSASQVNQTLQKAKRRVEEHFIKLGFGKGKKKDGSMEDTQASYLSRRSSLECGDHSRDSEFVVLKERKMVPLTPLLHGMVRFAFLLETCPPGSMPDPYLLAAVLDLPHAPVVAKAALLLECSHFVHCCNRGQWPAWMKLNFPIFRPSGPVVNRGATTGQRRTQVLQRTAGKMFYQWAEALGSRLEELLQEDKQNVANVVSMVSEEGKQKELLAEDEEEDFLDESSVSMYGSECPIALRLVACHLLLEVTAYLRETYQALPKSSRASAKERPGPWERLYTREVNNRRWSMALSSMGHSQTSAQSLQSIPVDRDAARKISFVHPEPDNESEGSSNTTVTMHGEEGQSEDKKGRRPQLPPQIRPFLSRRGTAGATTGSFKRRSFKLGRSTKDTKDFDCELVIQQPCTLMSTVNVKRTDSIQSKRKVSSLSDRSDNSEQGCPQGGEASGEESPAILSDDQPPESPSDSNEAEDLAKSLPWMKAVVQLANSFNFYCSHQSFCHPFCYRRHMRASCRLVKSVRKVYGEEFGIAGEPDSDVSKHHHDDTKKDRCRGRKVSDQTSTQASPIKRKDSVSRRDRIDGGASSRFLSSHRDSSRDIADQSFDKTDGHSANFASRSKKSHEDKAKELPPIQKYIKNHLCDVFHTPLAVLVKGAVVLAEEVFVEMLPVAWQLLLEPNQEVAANAASLFILAAVKAPNQTMELMHYGLQHHDPATRINAILRFQVLWKLRYQVWPRMEDGAHVTFKVPPPGIEFTLPSPKIGKESLPVVDPPWMPKVKTKVEEVTISQESHRSLVTATKTRKKQQTELIKMALQAQEDKKRAEREGFLITTIPITVQAAFEPSLHHAVGDDHDDANVGDEELTETAQRNMMHHIHSAHSLFPSCLCSAVIQIINLLDDAAVSADGNAVYEVSYQVIWSCLVEDSALFLRYILERLTRDKQELMFKILRHLIRFVPKLPQQAAFALYNYIIGYVMFYVRSPQEEGQKLIGAALSILWMVVHSVHGIMFKDLKQILRKEQCDASILLTANVPSAKKIIVHGPQDPDVGGIPSQFPVQEDTQFCQILRESLDFFGIDEPRHREYFLVDHKTHQIHNPSSYVRDFYFFKRSQYPQLELIHMKPDDAFNALQRQELLHKFVEIGKVLLTWAILKNVDMVVQRVVFLHEELMKLPSFPRKALEADLDLYKGGEMGKELLGLDVLHKFMWVRLIARMFEAMAGNFAYSGDIHLFLNVLNGAIFLHSEDACILRYVTATYINAVHHFKNIFSTNGYLLVMPTLLQLYANHQTNKLVKTTVEYAVKQFYLVNRKPFILQMFGSVSAILDTDEDSQYGDAHRVQSSCLFNLLLSLETPSPDPLNIGELVKEEKPLKAIDFCYRDENEMVSVLDCISLCVMVISYAADSVRGRQMLTILEAILPSYIQHIQLPTYSHGNKTEKEIIHQLAIAVKTLVNNCESLAKNYNGPQKTSPEHKGSSQRNYSRGPYSPGYDFEDDSHSKYMSDHSRSKIVNEKDFEDPEVLRNEFRRPRDILLSLVAEFLTKSSLRLSEISKKAGQDGKNIELLDIKSHVRLAEVAHSLLKVSPYDPETMACRGLQRYMNDLLPSTEWSNEAMRPALIMILRRLDKTFNKIYKKPSIRRHTDWEAAASLLKGIYETLSRYPYIVHMQHLKTLINTCQSLIVGETNVTGIGDCVSSATTALMSQVPPPHFCSTVVRLIALQILAVGENYSLEQVCGGSSMLPTAEKTETMLMNLLMPLCLRVGSGRKDVPKMRQADINFALTVVLHAMCPPTSKTAPVNAQNIKTASEIRCGSVTHSGREKALKISKSLCQVSFLALKIMLICFENDLVINWSRVATTVREMGRYADIGPEYWSFLDFVVTHHTPLFVLLQPFILKKLSVTPSTDHERHLQFIVREKLRGYNLPIGKGKATLLMDLAHEMKALKERLEDKKYDKHRDSEQATYIADMHQLYETVSHARTHRPSLIDLLTGDRGHAQEANPTNHAVQTHRGSVSLSSVDHSEGCGPADTQSSTTASENAGRVHSDKTHQHDEPKVPTQKCDAFLPLQKASKLRFVSSVELRHSSGETSTTPLTPGSPVDDSSGEQGKPRLQRSKAQSRKTFRLRKSRRSHIQVSHIKVEPQHAAGQQHQQHQMMELCVSSPAGEQRHHHHQQQQQHQQHQHHQRLPLPVQHARSLDSKVPVARDHSWDDTSQTSSASGYNESYSLLMMALESPVTPGAAPPLASPDAHDLPSTSSAAATAASTTTNNNNGNYSVAEGSSPDSSINSATGEDTALLEHTERTLSQHSLLITFEVQDEDTLI